MNVASVWINRVLILLGAVGIFLTGVLSYSKSQNLTVPCGGNMGCAAVQNSDYSMIGPLPVSYLGLLGFVVLFALAVGRLIAPIGAYRRLGVWGLAMAGGGTLFSVYLTFISFAIIEQKCIWCLSTLATMIVTTIAYGALLQADSPEKPDKQIGVAFAAAALVISTSVAFMVAYNLKVTIPPAMLLVKADRFTLEQVLPDEAKIMGNKNAKVTIVEFADINCHACRESFPMVKKILAKHGDGVRLAYRHFPLIGMPGHETSVDAAVIAEYAASKGMFWKYLDTVMDASVTERIKSIDGLFGVAGEAGLDRAELRLLFNSVEEEHKEFALKMAQSVTDDLNLARQLGIGMTPTFLIYTDGHPPKVVTANMLDMTLMGAPYKNILAGK